MPMKVCAPEPPLEPSSSTSMITQDQSRTLTTDHVVAFSPPTMVLRPLLTSLSILRLMVCVETITWKDDNENNYVI